MRSGECGPVPCLPGEDKAPACQRLSPVYDLSISRLNSFRHGTSQDGFPVTSIGMPCDGEQLMFDDWDSINSFLLCGSKAI